MSDAQAPPGTLTIRAAQLYLLLFPVGHFFYQPVVGAMATTADVAMAVMAAAWAVDLLSGKGPAAALAKVEKGGWAPGLPPRRYFLGILLLCFFSVWVALSRVWGFHGDYAVAKGVGLGSLLLGAAALASSGIGWKRAVDAWLAGTALALLFTFAVGALGPEVYRERLLHGGSGILGLFFARISGPFLHPNQFGDYLVVSGLLLWGRFPELSARWRMAAMALAVFVTLALALTLSTAWVGAGVAAAVAGVGVARGGSRRLGILLVVLGAGAALATAFFLSVPFAGRILGVELFTSGMRPAIWKSATEAFLTAPILGVGAAPFLAQAVDPLSGADMWLWDAHNAYLSILGQFGLVGAALMGSGLWVITTSLGPKGGVPAVTQGVLGAGAVRRRAALGLAVLCLAVNAVFTANEDSRHVWLLMGMIGVLAGEEA